MVLKLYKMDLSPPARAAMMACDLLNLPVEMIDVNLLEKEHMTPEFLQKNPIHAVPVLEHDDYVISDSHAIMMYLFDVFAKDDKFYPKDAKRRGIVNQILFFDTAILFPRLRNVTYSAIIEGVRNVTEKQLNDIEEAFHFTEQYLSKSKYIAGEEITIGDLSAYADITSLIILKPLDGKKYPKTEAWIHEMGKQSYSQKYNVPGVTILKNVLNKCLDL